MDVQRWLQCPDHCVCSFVEKVRDFQKQALLLQPSRAPPMGFIPSAARLGAQPYPACGDGLQGEKPPGGCRGAEGPPVPLGKRTLGSQRERGRGALGSFLNILSQER